MTEQMKRLPKDALIRSLIDFAADGVFLLSKDGKIIEANKQACRDLGYTTRELTALHIGDIDSDFTEVDRWSSHFESTKLNVPSTLATRHRRKDGSTFPVEIRTTKIQANGDTFQLALVRNVSEREQAQHALQESEKRYRRLFESSRDATMTLAPPSWRFTSGNPATVEMFDTDDEATFISLAPWQLSPEFQPDGQPSSDKAAKMIATAMKEGSHDFEWTHKRLDGDVFPATVRLTRITLSEETLLLATVRDISEQKKATDDLIKSHDKLALIIDTLPCSILIMDQDRRIIRVNKATEKATERDSSQLIRLRGGEALGCINSTQDPRGCGFGKDCANCSLFKTVESTLHTGTPHFQKEVSATVLAPGQRTPTAKIFLISTALLSAGDKKEILVCLEDITERKQAEEEISRLTTELQTIFNSASLAIWYKDLNNRFIRVNSAGAASAGLTPEEIEGKTAEELFPEEAAGYHADDMEVVSSGHPKLGIIERLQIPGGEKRWVKTDKVPFRDDSGTITGIIVFVEDITDHRRTEHEREQLLHEKGERIKELRCLYGVAESIRTHETIEEVFRDVVELISQGWQYPEITCARLTTKGETYATANPAFRLTKWVQVAPIVAREHLMGQLEVCYLEERPELDEGPFLTEERNLINGIASALSGAVSRRQIWEEKTEIEEMLRQSQKLEALGRLAGGIAHDFNNLLTAITGYSALLLEDLREDDPMREPVEAILQAGEASARLTQQLLLYSVRSKDQNLTPIALNEIIREILNMLIRTVGENITISCSLDLGLERIMSNTAFIEQILVNLVVNAKDAMPDGGKIRIKTRLVEERVPQQIAPTQLQPPYVEFTIRDTGTGISEDQLPLIFEPFFTTKRRGEGSGLGLSGVFGLVNKMGGEITSTSKLNEGTTFHMFFPITEEEASPKTSKFDTASFKRTNCILFIEDNKSVRDVTVAILKRRGFKLLIAQSGEEAIDTARTYRGTIDLLLSDVVMPDMTGPEAARIIERDRPEMKILFISGYPRDHFTRNDLLTENDELLEKPLRIPELLKAIAAILDQPKKG